MTFEKGKAYHIWLMDTGRIQKIHIVELIENDMIVYKFFGKHKRWWHYRVESQQRIKFYHEQGIKEKEHETTDRKSGS
jgi:hypothetical protein